MATKYRCNVFGIGSHLQNLIFNPPHKRRRLRRIFRFFDFHPVYIWGTGFINNNEIKGKLLYRNTHFLAVRGELSKQKLEKAIGRNVETHFGDGGLLVERWIGTQEKKYSVGIIPHYKEHDHPFIQILNEAYADSVIINLRDDPRKVVTQIAQCEYKLSSSLHGLVIADSFHIPNRHMILYDYGERMLGDGFKFEDYYSSYGLVDEPLRISSISDIPSISSIGKEYKVPMKMVEEIKDYLYNSFMSVVR